MGETQDGSERFGALLKQYRRAAGLTQEALAEQAGYSTVYLSMLERGRRRPQTATIDILCTALGLSPLDRTALLAAVSEERGTDIVGRSEELALLTRHLRGEGPPVLLFAGEPGIGKTRLLREARRLALSLGWRVLKGGCSRRGGQLPYAPLLGALQHYLRAQDADRLRVELDGCAWLVRLLPELAAFLPAPAALPPDQERRLTFDALARALRQVAGPAGVLLLLDDLQWAGTDAFDSLLYLLEADVPLRVIAAYRDVETARHSALALFLGDLAQAEWATHRVLTPLSADEAAGLLDVLLAGADGAPLADDLRARTLARTGGVPFFIVSYAQEVRDASPEPGSVPWDVAESIRRRVAELPEDARALLAIAAVAGRKVTRRLLGDVSGLEGSILTAMLADIVRARFLVEAGDHGYRFGHDVIREVVEGDLGAAARTDLHRRIADALVDEDAVETLAYHYAHSDREDRALFYLERAGDRSQARYAHAAAEGYYRELVDRLEIAGRLSDAARAREKLGTAIMRGGRYDSALTVLDGAVQLYRQLGEIEQEWLVTAQIGRVHERRGTPEMGIERLERLRLIPHAHMPAAEAALAVVLAPLYLLTGRYAEQLAAAESAGHLAAEIGDERLEAEAEVWRGCALNQLGRLEEGLAAQAAAIPAAEAGGDLVTLSHALNDLGFLAEVGGDFERSRQFKLRALELAERGGDPLTVATMAFRCGQNAFLRGDWAEAERYFERGMKTSHALGSSSISAYPPFGLALLAFGRGALPLARAQAEATLRIAEGRDLQAGRAALALLAESDLLDGNASGALDRLSAAGPDGEGLGLYPVEPVRAATLSALCRAEEARETIERAVRHATERSHRVALVDALRVRASIVDRTAAERDLDEALALARSMGYHWGEVRVLETRAAVLNEPQALTAAQALRRDLTGAPILDTTPDQAVGAAR